jgi:hypothetical protein
MSLKKGGKDQDNLDSPSKARLIFKTRNLWNSKPGLYRKDQFQTNLMLKDEIKKNNWKKIQSERNDNQKNENQI